MIRDTSYSDNDELIKMCKSFFSRSGYARLIDFDKESMLTTLDNLRDNDNGILLLAENDGETIGMIGALIYPFYFNTNHMTGQELFWWVDEDYRDTGAGKALLEAVEAHARELGAETFTMIALDSMSPEKVGDIYENNGYVKSEHSYIRSL